MSGRSNPELRARWLELSPESQQPFAHLLRHTKYRATHLLGLSGADYPCVAVAIKTVLVHALESEDSRIPYFRENITLVNGIHMERLKLYLGVAILSSLMDRPGLGERYDGVLFLRHLDVAEETYLDILDTVITRANVFVKEAGVTPVPTLRDVKFPLGRLLEPDT